MPFYQAMAGSGGMWATTTSSTTSSYNNPFYGAMGGTGTTTDGWNSATGSTVFFVNTVTTTNQLPFADEQMQRELMSRYQQEINRANEYNRIMMAQEAARVLPRPPQITEEEARAAAAARRADQERAHAERARQIAEHEQKVKAVRERAKELLLSKLSSEQRATFAVNGWFVVEGGKSKKKYRIRSNHYQGNIDVLDLHNNVTYRLCVHCAHDIPLEDHLLAQKTMLELAEDDIVKLANRHAA